MDVVILPKEIILDADKEILFSFPDDAKIQIENVQLEINCGFNMLGKQIQITVCGEQELQLPVIALSQMYKHLIDLISIVPGEKGWNVTHLLIKPCQKINYPITFGINKLKNCFSFVSYSLIPVAEYI